MPYPSAKLKLELAQEKQAAVRQQANALDTKAAALVGFNGVILGLLFSSDLAAERWNILFTIGAGVLTAAIIPLGSALFPRRYGANPNIGALIDKYANRSEGDIAWIAAKSIRRSIRTIGVGSLAVAVAIAIVQCDSSTSSKRVAHRRRTARTVPGKSIALSLKSQGYVVTGDRMNAVERSTREPPVDEQQPPASEEEIAELDDWLEEGLVPEDGDYKDRE